MEMFFRKLEYAIEGDAASQRLLAKAPWTANKIARKGLKHLLFYLASFIIANFFLAYIIGSKDLWKIITGPMGEHVPGLLSLVVFSGVFYGVYAFFREQVCTVVCPYGRLQGVLLDRNSMIVAYDYKRGEPRGRFDKRTERTIGNCIDCLQCVKVCPTGIDIRNGNQMECIGCTACIDACNTIMKKTKLPPGLIRYASENGLENNEKLKYTARMKLYTALLGILVLLLGTLLFTRKEVDATIMRTPGMLYQERGADSISNLYNIKVVNKTTRRIQLQLKLEQQNGRIDIIGERNFIDVKEQGQGSGSFFIILPKNVIHFRKTPLQIGIYDGDKRIDVVRTNFLGTVDE